MDTVSVIIPVYNNSKYLKECIDSVINQTYKKLEIIIVDDCSTDGSIDIIKSYNDKRIKTIFHKKNKGSASTRNDGIKSASGRYLAFIDSDDYWELDKILKQVKFIKDNNYHFIYSNYYYYKNGKTHIAKVPSSLDYNGYLKNTAIFTSTVLIDMKYFNKKDVYMPDLPIGQDAATWMSMLKKVDRAYGMKDILSIYRVGNNSISSNKFKASRRTWNLYKRENIKLIKRIYYFISYAYNAIKRRVL